MRNSPPQQHRLDFAQRQLWVSSFSDQRVLNAILAEGHSGTYKTLSLCHCHRTELLRTCSSALTAWGQSQRFTIKGFGLLKNSAVCLNLWRTQCLRFYQGSYTTPKFLFAITGNPPLSSVITPFTLCSVQPHQAFPAQHPKRRRLPLHSIFHLLLPSKQKGQRELTKLLIIATSLPFKHTGYDFTNTSVLHREISRIRGLVKKPPALITVSSKRIQSDLRAQLWLSRAT